VATGPDVLPMRKPGRPAGGIAVAWFLKRIAGFILGAVIGNCIALLIFGLVVATCTTIELAKRDRVEGGWTELALLVYGGYASIILGTLIGGVLGLRWMMRRDRRAVERSSVTKL
jgi:hypothetical protein